MTRKAKPLPTLEQCEKAIGEKAPAWVARCYEISCAIVKAKLVDGVAVYGHWTGPVHSNSHFANRRGLPFVAHGWIRLKDDRVLDPTRWVFEHVKPYLYVGEEPDTFGVVPCANCELLAEEHGERGPADQCDEYTMPEWPYDEGGNKWRELMNTGRPRPSKVGPRKKVRLSTAVAEWVAGVLDEKDPYHLTSDQLRYLANMSYDQVIKAVGPVGLRTVYTAVVDFCDTAISWIPLDNFNRAKRECGLKRDY